MKYTNTRHQTTDTQCKSWRANELKKRVDEREALEVICNTINGVDYKWLKPSNQQNKRTPDLELRLPSREKILVEITMHIYDAEHPLVTKNIDPRLKYHWTVMISQTSECDESRNKIKPKGSRNNQTGQHKAIRVGWLRYPRRKSRRSEAGRADVHTQKT